MKAAIYTRVSTLEQATTGYSLDAQKSKLMDYAKRQNYNIVDVYCDDGFSGASLHRPALTRLLNDIEKGKIDIIIIYNLDRLSRNVRNTLELIERLAEKNVQLYSLSQNIDLASPFGRAALKMSATFSELEREQIIERSKLGKEQAAKSGRYFSSVPFGYSYDPRHKIYSIVPEEAEMVKKIFELYINGMTFRECYRYGKESFRHPYFGNPLCCKAMLHRKLYSGFFDYNGTMYKATNIEPILSYETYLRAQDRIQKNKTIRRHESSPYLLTGLLYCGECGNRYVGKLYANKVINKSGNVRETLRYTYGCTARLKRDKNYHPALCKNDIIPAEKLENQVETELHNLTFSEFTSSVAKTSFIDKLIVENSSLNDKLQKLLDVYLDGLITKEIYALRVAEVEKALDKNKVIIDAEIKSATSRTTTDLPELKEQAERYDVMTKNEKRKFLAIIINRIVIYHTKIIIDWRVK